jgi:hypothetical protein
MFKKWIKVTIHLLTWGYYVLRAFIHSNGAMSENAYILPILISYLYYAYINFSTLIET